jgi:hypothetical protein
VVPVKGLLFDVVREVVADLLGEDAWDRAIESAGYEGSYTSLGNYPDAEMATLVVLLAESAGLSVDDTLRTVGIHGWRHLEQRQPELVAGVDDLGTLLHSLNHVVHTEVRKLYPDSLVPQFDIADEGPGRWLVTYESERRMCRLAEGLLIGFSDSRGISTAITHVSCINYGDAACVLDVVVS